MKRILFAALLCALSAPVAAQQFCVGNSADLESRIFQAHGIAVANPHAVVEIRLRRNALSYVINSLPDSYYGNPYGSLSLRGGYDDDPADNCTDDNRLVNALNTRITMGANLTSRFTVRGNFLLEGLQINAPTGLVVVHTGSISRTIDIASNIIGGGAFRSLHIEELDAADAAANLRIVNNLVTGTTAPDGCGVSMGFLSVKDTAELANNTIVGNEGAGVCFQNMAAVRFDNNIIWNNARGLTDRVPGNPSPVTLLHNILQPTNTIPGLAGTHVGGLSVDPAFAAGGFRPAANSPAINSGGAGSVPGGLPLLDLDGNARVVGTRVDRGAYESFVEDTDVIVVNTDIDTLDTTNGTMSFRSALLKANSDPGTETIKFDIGSPALCEAKIVLDPQLGDLPYVLEDLVVDGYTQGPAIPNSSESGFNANICIALVGFGEGGALVVPSGTNANLVVRGMRLAGFDNAVWLNGGVGHLVEGNSFDPGSDESNHKNVFLGASGAFVGGLDPAQRNLLSGASTAAVLIFGDSNFVVGNRIGPRVDGISDPESRNHAGVRVNGGDNNVVQGNFVVGNIDNGVEIAGAKNTLVTGNTISSNVSGVVITSAADGAMKSLVASNEISYNTDAGIVINDENFENRLVGNRIHHNGGQGIDISGDGVINANDIDASLFASPLGNRGLNFPVLAQAKTLDGELPNTAQVLGVLNSANGTFQIRFYANDACDASGHGEGEEPVGTTTIQITNGGQSGNGSRGFSAPVASLSSLADRYLTATATDSLGNTSEFGACKLVDIGQLFRDGFEGS